MINQLGFYEARSGKVVKITKLYENQPMAEGFIYDGFLQKTFHVWNVSGAFLRWGDHDFDIIRFMYSDIIDSYSDD